MLAGLWVLWNAIETGTIGSMPTPGLLLVMVLVFLPLVDGAVGLVFRRVQTQPRAVSGVVPGAIAEARSLATPVGGGLAADLLASRVIEPTPRTAWEVFDPTEPERPDPTHPDPRRPEAGERFVRRRRRREPELFEEVPPRHASTPYVPLPDDLAVPDLSHGETSVTTSALRRP